jgi:hypothetical protein
LGYTEVSHTVEIFGLCSACSNDTETAQP